MWKHNTLVLCSTTVIVASYMGLVYLYFYHTKEGTEIDKITSLFERFTDEKCISVCNSSECLIQANILLRNMKSKTNPCDNFNTFLCGEFEEKFGPDDYGSSLNEANSRMLKKLEEIIENIKAEPRSASGKVKILYESCLDYGHELLAINTAIKVLDDLGISDWPKLQKDFKFSKYDLSAILGKLRAYGVFEFLIFHTQKNETELEPDKMVIRILYSERLARHSLLPKNSSIDILKYFDLEASDISEIAEDLEAIENSILQLEEDITICSGNCSDTYHVCSEETDIEIKYLCDTVKAFLHSSDLEDIISNNVIGIVRHDDLPVKVIPLLKRFSDRSVANFLALKFFWRNLGELNFYYRRINEKYYEEGNIMPVYIETTKYCINFVSNHMIYALAHEFFQHYLTRPALEQIFSIYDEHLSSVADIISQQSWMTPFLRSALEEKIGNITNNMAYFKELLPNETLVNEYYRMFNPIDGNFFHNALELRRLIYISQYNEIQSFSDYGIRGMALQSTRFLVQASTEGEFISFHFGMFFLPVYLYGLEKQFNFASLGFIISHELGHILQLSLGEKMIELELYDTFVSFQNRKQCIEDQFSKFKFRITDENLNGTRYFDENLSDSLSTSLFDRMIGNYDSVWKEVFLPGLPYSGKQLLFMTTNQFWCSKISLESEMEYKNIDLHPPLEFRILGKIQNSRRFSEIFQCPIGSFMNPDVKCSLLDDI